MMLVWIMLPSMDSLTDKGKGTMGTTLKAEYRGIMQGRMTRSSDETPVMGAERRGQLN